MSENTVVTFSKNAEERLEILRDEKGNFLLVQYSDSYDEQEKARVNVMHMNVRIKR